VSERALNAVRLDGHAETLVRFKARQLSRRKDFSPSDEEDLRQELWLHLLSRIDGFDPQRGSLRTFVNQVVNSAVAMILRGREQLKRSMDRTVLSLESTVIDVGGGVSLPASEAVSPDDLQRRVGSKPRDRAELDEDVEAVQAALALMPPHVRRVARHLMSDLHTSVACECGLSRRQVRIARQQIRELLEQTGFEEI
jgi:RNA polymerase sigma factor (sigma-70 family)